MVKVVFIVRKREQRDKEIFLILCVVMDDIYLYFGAFLGQSVYLHKLKRIEPIIYVPEIRIE